MSDQLPLRLMAANQQRMTNVENLASNSMRMKRLRDLAPGEFIVRPGGQGYGVIVGWPQEEEEPVRTGIFGVGAEGENRVTMFGRRLPEDFVLSLGKPATFLSWDGQPTAPHDIRGRAAGYAGLLAVTANGPALCVKHMPMGGFDEDYYVDVRRWIVAPQIDTDQCVLLRNWSMSIRFTEQAIGDRTIRVFGNTDPA